VSALYAEPSAVLRWLLGHSTGRSIAAELARAGAVVTSRLSSIEVARALARNERERIITQAARLAAENAFADAAASWTIHALDDDVVARAAARFPVEPVRALDAVHLATAVVHADLTGRSLCMLSTDERVRDNARALGFTLKP
jgi:predicted nucleic acid-binding protein